MSDDAQRPARRGGRRQPVGLPGARGRRRGPRRARRARRAPGRVRPPDARPPVPLRRGGRRPWDPGDRRGRRRRGAPARDARGQDDRCRSSACRSRPSTWVAWTRCFRSCRCRAGSRSRPSRSATPTNAGLLAASILALGDEALAARLADWRARQTASGARRPVERRRLIGWLARRQVSSSTTAPGPARRRLPGARRGAGRYRGWS